GGEGGAEAEVRGVEARWKGGVGGTQTRLRASNGETVTVVLGMRAITDARGDVIYQEGIVLDVADRVMLDMQCLQTQKQETFGLLVTDVVHNFKNVLTSISGYSELVMQELDAQRADIEEILKASQRAAELARG